MKNVIAITLCLLLAVTGCVRPGEPGSSANNPISINLNGAQLTFLDASAIPDITGNSSKFLGNNGTALLWLSTNGSGNLSTAADIIATLGYNIGTSNVTLPITQGNVTGLVQALSNITTNASQNYTLLLNNGGNITILQGNVTSLQAAITSLNSSKQNTLVSGTSLKTINGVTLLGAGDLAVAESLPNMTGQSGKYLTNNGTDASWGTPGGGGNVTGPIADIDTWLASKSAIYYPTSAQTVYGTLISGSFSSMNTSDGVTYNVSEAVGANALQVAVNFTSVITTPTGFTFRGSYNGSVNHDVHIEVWNYITSAWDLLDTIQTTTVLAWRSAPFPHGADYVSGNLTQLRFRHEQVGSGATHGLNIDYFVVDQSLTAGGVQGVDLSPYIKKDGSVAFTDNLTGNLTVTGNISASNIFIDIIGNIREYLLNMVQDIANVAGNLTAHIIRNDNPHNVTIIQLPGLSQNLTDISGNVSVNTQNISNVAGNLTLKLNTSNVTTTPSANKVPSTNSSGRLDAWMTRGVSRDLFSPNITVTAQNETKVFVVPAMLAGHNISAVWAGVSTNSSSGNITVNIWNVRLGAIVASVYIDANEGTSYTAATSPVINTANSGLQAGDILRYDVINAGTGAKGLQVGFQAAIP